MAMIIFHTNTGALYVLAPGALIRVGPVQKEGEEGVKTFWRVMVDTPDEGLFYLSRAYPSRATAKVALSTLAREIDRRAGDASGLISIDLKSVWGMNEAVEEEE